MIIVVSCVGIFEKDFYAKETFNWRAQALGQDMVDLFLIVPALLVTAILTFKRKGIAALLWAGTVLYVIYTFMIYCFDVHFNRLFIVYCLALGLSFYSFLWFLFTQIKAPIIRGINKNSAIKITAVYFIVIPVIFYCLWLSEIIPATINDRTPKSLREMGLFTNPVHVLDLSLILPAILVNGILIFKRDTLGFALSFIILSFFILMDITIGWLAFMMKQKGVESNLSVTIVMTILTLFSLAILIWNSRNISSIGEI